MGLPNDSVLNLNVSRKVKEMLNLVFYICFDFLFDTRGLCLLFQTVDFLMVFSLL